MSDDGFGFGTTGVDRNRMRLHDLMCHTNAQSGGPFAVRAGWSMADGKMRWHLVGWKGAPTYDYRCLMGNESVFDVGDHTEWDYTARLTNALWDALNWFGIPYWGALSGGRGTHTHVFWGKRREVRASRPVAPAARPYGHGKAALDEAPPCVRAITQALLKGEQVGHAARLAMASYYTLLGVHEDDIVNLFTGQSNFKERTTRDQLRSIQETGYLPRNCDKMRGLGLCPGGDDRCGRITNPITYAPGRWRSRSLDVVESDEVRPFPQDEVSETRWKCNLILSTAARFMLGDAIMGLPEVDPLFLEPTGETRQVREFGCAKDAGSGRLKTLWTQGPGPFTPLPLDRDEAYRSAGTAPRYPQSLHLAGASNWPGWDSNPSAPCPQGPECLPSPDGWKPCISCPRRT